MPVSKGRPLSDNRVSEAKGQEEKGTGGFFVRCDLIIDFTNIAVPE